jgi:hypothetical protein
VWSKFKIDEDLSDEEILERVERRFNKTLPLHRINLHFVQSLENLGEGGEEEHEGDEGQTS